jgi:hypothetical protein
MRTPSAPDSDLDHMTHFYAASQSSYPTRILEYRLLPDERRFAMPTIDSLETLLVNELRDLLDAENRLTKTLPNCRRRLPMKI